MRVYTAVASFETAGLPISFRIEDDLNAAFAAAGMTGGVVSEPEFITAAQDLDGVDSQQDADTALEDNNVHFMSRVNRAFNGNAGGSPDPQLLTSGVLVPQSLVTVAYWVEVDTTNKTQDLKLVSKLTALKADAAGNVVTDTPVLYSRGGDRFPANMTVYSAQTTPNDPAVVVFPPKVAASAIGTDCPANTTPGTTNLIQNGDFTRPNDRSPPFVSSASNTIASSFFSDVPLVHAGLDKSLNNDTDTTKDTAIVFPGFRVGEGATSKEYGGSIALVRHAIVDGSEIQQFPMPNGPVTWLAYSGNTSGKAPQKFWRQTVNVQPGKTYRFSAYVSSASRPVPAQANRNLPMNDPRVMLYAAGEEVLSSTGLTMNQEDEAVGDTWTRVQAVFRTASNMNSVELAVGNKTVGGDGYSVMGLANLQLVECTATVADNSTAGANSGAPTLASPATSGTGGTSGSGSPGSLSFVSGGGGGGGAFGAGWLSLLGLAALGRRRWVKRD